jgi:hypothetical protein
MQAIRSSETSEIRLPTMLRDVRTTITYKAQMSQVKRANTSRANEVVQAQYRALLSTRAWHGVIIKQLHDNCLSHLVVMFIKNYFAEVINVVPSTTHTRARAQHGGMISPFFPFVLRLKGSRRGSMWTRGHTPGRQV